MAERNQSLQRGSERTQEQQHGLSRRHRDPWGLSLLPGELFSMDPFSTMRRMQQEMDRIFGGSTGSAQEMRAWSPAIEVSERDGNYVVCAELPGLSANDVNVELTDEALVIEGERKQEHTQEEGGIRRSERSYGHFYRAIPLPENIKSDQAKANFKDGVLEVKIPIQQQEQKEQRRRIPIESGQQSGSSQNMGSPGGLGTSGGGSNTGSQRPNQGSGSPAGTSGHAGSSSTGSTTQGGTTGNLGSNPSRGTGSEHIGQGKAPGGGR